MDRWNRVSLGSSSFIISVITSFGHNIRFFDRDRVVLCEAIQALFPKCKKASIAANHYKILAENFKSLGINALNQIGKRGIEYTCDKPTFEEIGKFFIFYKFDRPKKKGRSPIEADSRIYPQILSGFGSRVDKWYAPFKD